jgi:uncharacterized iron-regulated protein
MRHLLTFVVAIWAAPLWAAFLPEAEAEAIKRAEVVLLGEVHDNPAHHTAQAALVAELAPSAVVWEMLTEVQAALYDPALVDTPEKLAETLGWAEAGWPDFALYHPIFAAAPEARVYGAALPRDAARAAMEAGPEVSFGAAKVARFGLSVPLSETDQQRREAYQMAAHCDALPAELLPQMVEIQRLRDAMLAEAALRALAETGGPVVVITGNGHARRDWGAPVYLARAAPGLRIFALGQSEAGAIDGSFDAVIDAAPVERPDPCDAFRRSD